MLRALLVVLAALVTAAALAPVAGAATRSCRTGYYAPGLDTASPAVSALKARNLPRRTDGYAPPCLVAESIAGIVQFRTGESGRKPATVRPMGARWGGGTWRCAYAGTAATCRKAGKPSRRVTFTLGA